MDELTSKQIRRDKRAGRLSMGVATTLQFALFFSTFLLGETLANYSYYNGYSHYHGNYKSGNYCGWDHTGTYCSVQGLSRNGEISDITYTSSGGRQYITPNYDAYYEWCCNYHATFAVWNDVTNVWDTVSNPATSYPFFENW